MEGSKSAFESFVKNPLSRAVGLGALLFTTDCVGHSCGHSEGLNQGRAEILTAARNCVEAAHGVPLTQAQEIPKRMSLETWDNYFDLAGLRAFCREELEMEVPQGMLALSANASYGDGTKVKIGNIIKTVPVE